MKTSTAIDLMKTIKNGTFGVVEYETELPVNKDAKNAGVHIFCKTRKMVRFGASYKNLISDLTSSEVKSRANNYSWIIENKISYNSKTDKDYLRISNINRKTISRNYRMETPSSTVYSSNLDGYESFLRPSSSNSGFKPIVQNISLSNVLSINGISD